MPFVDLNVALGSDVAVVALGPRRPYPNCPSGDLSACAVDEAVKAVPGPMSRTVRSDRVGYLVDNARRLFDPESTGYLDFMRFADFEWANVRLRVDPPPERFDFEEYLRYLYGPTDRDVEAWAKIKPWYRQSEHEEFVRLGGSKGYLDRSDFDKVSRVAFSRIQRENNGKVPITFITFEHK